MGLIEAIIVGLVVGPVTRFLKSGDDGMGWIMTILLGTGDSLLATYGDQAIGFYQVDQTAGLVSAVVGAVVLLIIYGLIKKG